MRKTGDKNNEQNNTTEESNSNDKEEKVPQSPLATQNHNVDAQPKVFISLILPQRKKLFQEKNLRSLFPRNQL